MLARCDGQLYALFNNAGYGQFGMVEELSEAQACKVELFLSYSFGNAAMAALVSPVFDKIASNLVDAFVQRAERVYG